MRPAQPPNAITSQLDRLRSEMKNALAQHASGGGLFGMPVYDRMGQKIGTVDQIRGSGASMRIVVVTGGFLGIGARPVVLNASEIEFSRADDGSIRAVTSLSKDALRAKPTHIDVANG